MFCFYLPLLFLPVNPERRIAQKIVERLRLKLILDERVTEPYVIAAAVVADLLHQHVGCSGGKCTLVVFLAIDVELRLRMMLAKIALRLGKHAARTTRGV